ncbi:MAG: hypothetical protein D8M59_03095 [Planctomycetes bacterium]|nr:hypothetical protein [Planctomycetota bacterium]NOG52981.1 hypothetical protein [Planctomycetota bacterium]
MKTKTFGKPFMTACKKGTSPWTWVQNCAKRNHCTENYVWNCLCKEGYAFCKKFNGHNCYFPTFQCKCPRTKSRTTEFNFWQYAVYFCMQQGWVTPEQVNGWSNPQMFYFCCRQFNKFYTKPKSFSATRKFHTPTTWCTYTQTPKSSTTRKTTRRRTTGRKTGTTTRNYKFSHYSKRKAA